ncbi:MAG TPA: twitch domain-containing radical SAM protein [Bacteroidales bacterium]|nr:twitch domain-containing radical SAM protein [Bacteroidales bacterium]
MRNVPGGLCVLPWIHLNIMPDGSVLHCCMSADYGTVAGDINKQTIGEIWNGDFMKSLRKKMIKGIKPAVCSRCFEKESLTGTSWRILYNSLFEFKLKEIPVITESDGHVDKVELRFWDFRFSNICNNKCRYCGPHYSSSWIPNARELEWISKNTSNKPTRIESIDQKRNADFFKKHINTIVQINFVGGEPLLMDEHWQILEMLDKCQRNDVNISYNTNLSILKYKNKNALDY